MTTKTDPAGAPEATESRDYIDLGADSSLERFVPDTFSDDAAAGIKAARARYFARRDSSPRRSHRGHNDGTRDGSADDRLLLNDALRSGRRGRRYTDPVNCARELGYRKPTLPLSFAIVVLVVSFAVFFLLAADHFAAKQHDGRGRQNTTSAPPNR